MNNENINVLSRARQRTTLSKCTGRHVGSWGPRFHISVSLRQREAWPTFLLPHLFLSRSTWSRSSWSMKPFPTISSSLRTTWKCASRKWVSLWNGKKTSWVCCIQGEANIHLLRSVPPRYPTTSTSERRNQSLKRIRRRRAEPRRTARAPKVGSPDSDTLRISRDTPGWGEKALDLTFFGTYYYKSGILTTCCFLTLVWNFFLRPGSRHCRCSSAARRRTGCWSRPEEPWGFTLWASTAPLSPSRPSITSTAPKGSSTSTSR